MQEHPSSSPTQAKNRVPFAALDQRLRRDVATLSSTEFAGRAPGTVGETKTTEYLAKRLKSIDVASAPGLQAFRQSVGLGTGTYALRSGIFHHPQGDLHVSGSDDLVLVGTPDHDSESDVIAAKRGVVFAGYGIRTAQRDDYSNLDVHDKIVIVLGGSPEVGTHFDAPPEAARWTKKRDIARELGAAGIIYIHDAQSAGYGYSVMRDYGLSAQYALHSGKAQLDHFLHGWMPAEMANRLLQLLNLSLRKLTEAAKTPPAGRELNVTFSYELRSKNDRIESQNIIGYLEGSDAARRHEHIIISAHWDHEGCREVTGKKQVYHGAVDNASAMAAVLEIAQRFSKERNTLPRSILFFFPTAEEKGLLGSSFYVQNSVLPITDAVLNINLEMMNVWGQTRSVLNIAEGTSDALRLLKQAAARQGRSIKPDPLGHQGLLYRSDHYSFLKSRVPIIPFFLPGCDYVLDSRRRNGSRLRFLREAYHTPNDVIDASWDLRGLSDDIDLIEDIVRRAATMPGRFQML